MEKWLRCIIAIVTLLVIAFTATITSVATTDPVLNTRTDFLWGVNTHQNFYAVYATANLEEQFHKMAEMGCKIVRTGFTTDFNHMDKVVAFANAYGMKVMATVGNVMQSDDEYDAVTEYEMAKMAANRYNGKNGYGKIDYFQISNEVDVSLLSVSQEFGIVGDGSSMSHYVTSEVERVCKHFKNSISGVRAADTDAQVVINSGWVHYGFHDWLKQYDVDYDIIGFDWYTDQSTSFIRSGKGPIEQADFLYERFNKKIIVCETNIWRNEPYDEEDPASWDDLIEIAKDAYTKPHVIGFCVYELCDNQAGKSDEERGGYYRENHFGIFYSKGSSMLGPKAVYGRLKNLWGGTETKRITVDDIATKSPIIDDSGDNDSSVPIIANEDTDNDNKGSSSYIYYDNDNDEDEDELSETVEEKNEDKKPSVIKTTRIPKKANSKYEWTAMDTISVVAGSVCVLLIAGCAVFIIIRRKQIKKLLVSA